MSQSVRGQIAAVGLAALVATGLFGCGASDSDTGATQAGEHEREQREGGGEQEDCERLPSESQREECERAAAAAVIPERDRIAYYQLATAAGLLRGAAVAAVRGEAEPRTAGRSELRDARTRLELTDPRDRGLTFVRRRMLILLGSAQRGLDRAAARRDLVAVRSIERMLGAYLRREPANAVLLPD